jgi:hypothetical protein
MLLESSVALQHSRTSIVTFTSTLLCVRMVIALHETLRTRSDGMVTPKNRFVIGGKDATRAGT